MKKIDYSIDKSNLRQTIINFPNQFKWVLDNWKKIDFDKKFSNVILCGMGGSALPMNFVANYASVDGYTDSDKIPIIIHRNYGLPKEANKDSLLIFSSYSGGTEETITAYKKALDVGINGIVMTSGGELEKIANKNKTAVLKIPDKKIPPRYATGYMATFLLQILADAGITKNATFEIKKASEYLAECLADGKLEERGYSLAKKIKNKIPIIYSSANYKIAAKVWKIKINENAKIPAFWNYIPELNHNEMVGFTLADPKQFFIIIVKDKDDSEEILKVTEITEKLLINKGFLLDIVEMKGDNFFSKIFYSTLLGDWVSYYLALGNGIDPTPVPLVDEFKKELKNKKE